MHGRAGDAPGVAQAAGADAVINYRDEPLAARVREATLGQGVDRIVEVDIAANAPSDLEMLRPGGQLVVYGSGASAFELPFFPLIVNNFALSFFIVYNLSVLPSGNAVLSSRSDRK